MGGSQSTVNSLEEQRKRKLEADRQEKLRKDQEEEKERKRNKQLEEQRKQQEQERKHQLQAEEMERKRRDEMEKENKLLEYKHLEEMQKIKDLEQGNQRKDNQTEKNCQLEHERMTQAQDQMYSILKDTFGKVKDVDINQAVYGFYIMQCIQSGRPIDKSMLEAVTSKVPIPYQPPNLKQIVEDVIHEYDEADCESSGRNITDVASQD